MISIHALRVEGDGCRRSKMDKSCYFYPRPPGGGRRIPIDGLAESINISIHALRVEGDIKFLLIFNALRVFLSTPSGWRATVRPAFSIIG